MNDVFQPTPGAAGIFARLVRIYDAVLMHLIAGILFLLVVLVSLSVFVRFVPTFHSLFWIEEVSFFLFTWITFLSIGPGIRRGVTMDLTYFVDFLPNIPRRMLGTVAWLLVAVFLVFLIKEGWRLTNTNMLRPSPVLFWPMGWIYLAVPLGSILALVEVVVVLVRLWRSGVPHSGTGVMP